MRALKIAALLLLLTIGFYWKLTLTKQYTWLENPDAAFQVMPWLDFQAREVHAHRLPLWDPYLWGGQSLIGQVQPGIANPLNWILFALPLLQGHIPVTTLHWYWVLIHWLATLAGYALCRGLGVSRPAAILGAVAFGLSGFMGASMWPQWLMSALWTPLMFLFFFRALRGERPLTNAARSGAAFGLALLGGHHQVPTFAALALIGLWIYALARDRFRNRRVWEAAALCGTVGLLVGALQVLPALEYGRAAVRWTGDGMPLDWHATTPYAVHDQYSAGGRALLGLVLPGWSNHANSFLGVVVVALALVGLLARWDKIEVKLLGAISLLGMLFALGSETLFQGILYGLIPFVDKARNPATAVAIAQVGICALAALGLDAWPGFTARPAAKRALLIFGSAILAVYLVLGLARVDIPEQRPAMVALAALLFAAVLTAWDSGAIAPATARTFAIALVLLEAGTMSLVAIHPSGKPDSLLQKIQDHADIADFLRHQYGWFRIEVNNQDVPENFGDYYGIDEFGGYVASMPATVAAKLGTDEARRIFGVRYVVASKPPRPGLEEVFSGHNELKVFRDRSIESPLNFTHPAGQSCRGQDQASLESQTSRMLVVRANMACRGTLIVGATDAPGWRVWVDHQPAEIQLAYGVVRAVNLPPGSHRVEFRYMPWNVVIGGVFSLVGLALVWLMAKVEPAV